MANQKIVSVEKRLFGYINEFGQKVPGLVDIRKDEIKRLLEVIPTLDPNITKAEFRKVTGLSSLGGISPSVKLQHSKLVNVATYIQYLAPANLAGLVFGQNWNTCPFASPECKAACLFDSGQQRRDMELRIIWSRLVKTAIWFLNRELFMNMTAREIETAKKATEKKVGKWAGFHFSVRLNGTSDNSPLNWKVGDKSIFELFPKVQFYDYTKNPGSVRFTKLYKNYHLTFSYTGHNHAKAIEMLENGIDVAIVFEKKLPKYWNGYLVIDGDHKRGDYRPDDVLDRPNKLKGIIVGLVLKATGPAGGIELDGNAFVVRLNDPARRNFVSTFDGIRVDVEKYIQLKNRVNSHRVVCNA